MATQSLYRRYRPRRFSELKGQDHIVRALRTSVAEGREGQAYLFSGPRGTGKTTTARIMAKVLNCQNPVDGEPCCECDSCISVEQGTSYDVHELDAASNNGVDAMRDLIEKASLGTPGRHKVYILDEVHMLSKGAEAALLKTLEEPPPHVVFVLATTDPQKMSDTIRSRTQHLQFHLLAPDTLQEHVRWVAEDAGLTVTDDAIEQVVAQGAGSPRDTLSFLELASNSGGNAVEVIALDEFVESMIDNEPGRALKMVAHAISRGRDPRTVTEELIAFLRNGFLALMAPDLVQLPSQRIEALTDLAHRLGAAGLVRGIETLGEALTEMRQAPDPRVLLDVATVQLTSEQVAAGDIAGLVSRIQKLERQVAAGATAPATTPAVGTGASAAPDSSIASLASLTAPETQPASPVDPSTGRAKLGSRAGATAPAATPVLSDTSEPTSQPAPDPEAPPATVPASASGGQILSADWDIVRPQLRGMARAVYSPVAYVSAASGRVTLGAPNEAHRAKCEQHRDAVEQALAAHIGSAVAVELVVEGEGGGGAPSATPAPSDSTAGHTPDPSASAPSDPDRSISSMSGSTSSGSAESAPAASTPAASTPAASTPVSHADPSASLSTSGALAHDDSTDPVGSSEPAHLTVVATEQDVPHPAGDAPVVNGRAIAEQARSRGPAPDPDEGLQKITDALPADDEIDLDDLIDAPPEAVKTPVDRLAEAFPGSELVDDPY